MRRAGVVTGTQKTRAVRIVVATLLSVAFVLYVVTAVAGAVNVSRLNNAVFPLYQRAFSGDVRSIAAMHVIVGFVAVIALSYPVCWACFAAKQTGDVQRTSGSSFDRLAGLTGVAFAVASFVIIVVYTMVKPQRVCAKMVDSQTCQYLMQQPLMLLSTICGVIASTMLFGASIVCLIKPRSTRQQPARYMQRIPTPWPESPQFRSNSIKSHESTTTDRSTSSPSPTQYKAKVYHYHKRQNPSCVTFNSVNPVEIQARNVYTPELLNIATYHSPPANNTMDYHVYERANTPGLDRSEGSSPSPPSSPSIRLCHTPSNMIRPSHDSLTGEAKAQRVKRKAVAYRKEISRRHSDAISLDMHDAVSVHVYHCNASFDTMTEFHDAASSVHEQISAEQVECTAMNDTAPVSLPILVRARTASLDRSKHTSPLELKEGDENDDSPLY